MELLTLEVTRAVNYEKAHVIYKVKVTNGLGHSITEVTVTPHLPENIFILDKVNFFWTIIPFPF